MVNFKTLVRISLWALLSAGVIVACDARGVDEIAETTNSLIKCTNDETCTDYAEGMHCEDGYCRTAVGSRIDTLNPRSSRGAAESFASGVAPGSTSAEGPGSTRSTLATDGGEAETPGQNDDPDSSSSYGRILVTQPPVSCEGLTDNLKPVQYPLPDEETAPYGYWPGEELLCPNAGGAGGWSDDNCTAVQCDVSCETELDCPDPGTGNPTFECRNSTHTNQYDGNCALLCDNGETCPDGMDCTPRPPNDSDPDQGQLWCMWASGRSSCELPHQHSYPSLGCAAKTTRETCEARIDESPVILDKGCIWVRESIVSTSSDVCEGTTTEHCIVGQPGGGEYTDIGGFSRCGGCGSLVFATDLGDGTASIVETEYKGYQPGYDPVTLRNWDACRLDTSPILPLICGCGCGEYPDLNVAHFDPPPASCEGVNETTKPREFSHHNAGVSPWGARPNEQLVCPGSGSHGWSNGACFEAEQCGIACESLAECPKPENGNALKTCQNEQCVLRCDEGQACPDGMECVPRPAENVPETEQERWCMWVTEGENESFACWQEHHGCTDFTTRETCEARIDQSPIVFDSACIWVRETLVSVADNACRGTTTERCVNGAECSAGDCGIGAQGRCGGCGSLISYGQRGAGTTSIVETTYKGYQPSHDPLSFGQWDQCDFDSDSTPEACNCACP